MTTFPLFIDLSDKKCTIIGGGIVAERKVEILLNFKARITVMSPNLTQGLSKLKEEGQITVIHQPFSTENLPGAFLMIAATPDRHINKNVYDYAINHGILVNVADCPEQCTFIFPAIVKRDGVVVGISTSGAYPALSKAIRLRVENLLVENYGEILPVLQEIRKRAALEITDVKKRREILNQIASIVDSLTVFTTDESLRSGIINRYEDLKNETRN